MLPQNTNVIVQQPLVSSGAVFAPSLKPALHILNKVFDSNIALLASFVTAVDYTSSYVLNRIIFSVIFVHLVVVK